MAMRPDLVNKFEDAVYDGRTAEVLRVAIKFIAVECSGEDNWNLRALHAQ